MVWVCASSDGQTATERRTAGSTMQARLSVWIDMETFQANQSLVQRSIECGVTGLTCESKKAGKLSV